MVLVTVPNRSHETCLKQVLFHIITSCKKLAPRWKDHFTNMSGLISSQIKVLDSQQILNAILF
jgi:hypothetical protein